ncbi:hypothetical protein FGIG_01128 [Fasciola gigantica]|uniref:Uncharacterized protein n=1 Tax=Fasciola gigantica TaxID=46835 RepID=A0A504YH56_FASGI|nr:hypothetical protein FGIG_01128 [Fasciola gigantica]
MLTTTWTMRGLWVVTSKWSSLEVIEKLRRRCERRSGATMVVVEVSLVVGTVHDLAPAQGQDQPVRRAVISIRAVQMTEETTAVGKIAMPEPGRIHVRQRDHDHLVTRMLKTVLNPERIVVGMTVVMAGLLAVPLLKDGDRVHVRGLVPTKPICCTVTCFKYITHCTFLWLVLRSNVGSVGLLANVNLEYPSLNLDFNLTAR